MSNSTACETAKGKISQHIAHQHDVKHRPAPLAVGQQRLWWLTQLQPDNAVHTIANAIKLQGEIDATLVQQALGAIVQRHQALRTTIDWLNDVPIQRVDPANIALTEVDLRFLPDALKDAACQQQIEQTIKYRFDVWRGDLLRATLIWLAAEAAVLLVTNHELVGDEHSMSALLWLEFGRFYAIVKFGRSDQSPRLPLQFSDFAIWQKSWLDTAEFRAQLAYWQQQLQGSLPMLELPTTCPRAAVQSLKAARTSFIVPDVVSDGLKTLSHQSGFNLKVILLAAFKTLLYRYSQQTDVVVGHLIEHRQPPELAQLIGHLSNYVALRTDLAADLTFRELLDRVQTTLRAAYAHQEVPFGKVLETLQLDHSLSHHPLFQVMFAYRAEPDADVLNFPNLTASRFAVATSHSEFDLTLAITAISGQVDGYFEYSPDLFDQLSIARAVGHWQTLLQSIVANPDQRLADLPILTLSERQQFAHWNHTELDYPQLAIHQLFAAQVERTPDAIAIVGRKHQLTYIQLNHQANQLAHHLQQLGVKPGDLVGICVERSPALLSSLLGILKAGAAYVPLDPQYPIDRLAMILNDAQTSVLVTQQSLLHCLPQHAAQLVLIDADTATIAQASSSNCQSDVQPSDLAYVLYTSGSTGRPKGVAIAHYSAVSFITWAQTVFTPAQLSGVLAATSICFDLSIFELFLPISMGGKVILADNALQLPQLPTAHQVTLINTVPSAMAALLRVQGIPPHVRTINLAGEPLSNQLVQALYQQAPIAQVYNLYGPSEATTYATFDLTIKGATTGPLIGKPLSNTQVYILDANLQPVPIGIPGELHIGGAGLAQGYLNRPELTAEKFIPLPAPLALWGRPSPATSPRLYKTGDLARYQPDGKIDFLGRIDYQVKIRGFRIELGEVEGALRQHDAVKDTMIMARSDVPGDQRLVAYVVLHTALTVDDLRHHLKQTLPDYMIPAAFVLLDALPLTPNGKIDRKALPAPKWSTSDQAFSAPTNAIEQQLAKIWQTVLGIPLISITENFFDLGGHSLLIMRLFSQIEQTFGQQLPLTILFQAPTIRQLAILLQQEGATGLQTAIVQFQSGNQPPLFCLPGAMGNLIYCRGLVRYLPSDQPIYGLQEPESWQGWNLPGHLEEIAAHYIQVLQTVQPHGPYFLLGYSFSGIVAYEMAQQLVAQGQSIAFLGLIDPPLAFSFNAIRRMLQRIPGFADRKFLVSTLRRLEIHQLRLSKLSSTEGLNYLFGGVRQRLQAKLAYLSNSPINLAPPAHNALTQMASKNYYRAVLNYFPQPYPQPISLILSRDTYSDFGYWGNWEKLTKINLHLIPGDHLSILREPDVQFLAERVQACLQAVDE